MRFVRPNNQPTPVNDGGWLVPKLAVPRWLRERLDSEGIYVLMDCGHKENTSAQWVLIRPVFPDSEVLCRTCNEFRTVISHLNFRQYLGVPESQDSPEPLF